MNKTVRIILTLILIVAAILRLVHPFQIPYTYDELSALSRTHFSSFSELIDKGIIIDGHPAGVQTFLYYWTRLFGYTEIVVKLPFITCGILAVYFMFKVGQAWFNPTVGLVCAAFLATLQYPIMYSQIVRPYSSGLFFVLAMVYYWHNLVFKPEERFYKNTALYILFSALCAYNHHFSLLFAAIVGFTGIFFIQKRLVLKYVVSGIAIFILYIPHLHIFFYQLHQGGLGGSNGWLGKPGNYFIIDYLCYIFQFSRTVSGLAIALMLFGIYISVKNGFTQMKYFIISLCWFLIPLLTGYFYSIYVNPVLQYSVLIFSFPFMLLCMFSWLPELNIKAASLVVSLVCIVNIFSLVHTRKYYNMFYKAPYEQPILLNDSLVKAIGKDNYTCLIQADDTDKSISNYYINKDHADTSFYWTDKFGCFATHPSDYKHLIHFMEQQKKTYFSFGCSSGFDPIVLQIISTYYPYIVKKWDFYGAGFYLMTNKPLPGAPALYSFESNEGFEGNVPYWSPLNMGLTCDTIHFSGSHSYKMDAQQEWAPAFSTNLKVMSWGKNDVIEASLELYPLDTLNGISIVSVLESNGKQIDYRETPVNKFIPDTLRKVWVKAYHAIKLQDIYTDYPNITVKIYIWNKSRKRFYMDDFKVKTLKGNPIMYGLTQKI